MRFPKINFNFSIIHQLAYRNFRRQRRLSLLLVCATTLTTIGILVGGVLQKTSGFDAQEMANISMGSADLMARANSGEVQKTYSDIVSGSPKTADISGVDVAELDLDLTSTLRNPKTGSPVSVTGRIINYKTNMAQGIFSVQNYDNIKSSLGLSKSTADALNVSLGDEVLLGSSKKPLITTYTDTLNYAPETSLQIFALNPASLTHSQLNELITSTSQIGSPRWLISTTTVETTASSLDASRFTVISRNGFSNQKPNSIPGWIIGISITTTGFLLLLGLVSSVVSNQSQTTKILSSLGMPWYAVSRTLFWRILFAVLPGFFGGSLVALLLAPTIVHVFEIFVSQNWGTIEWDWRLFCVASISIVIAIFGLVSVVSIKSTQLSYRAEYLTNLRLRKATLFATPIAASIILFSFLVHSFSIITVIAWFFISALIISLIHIFAITLVKSGDSTYRALTLRSVRESVYRVLPISVVLGLVVLVSTSVGLVLTAQQENVTASYIPAGPRGVGLISSPKIIDTLQEKNWGLNTNSQVVAINRVNLAQFEKDELVPAVPRIKNQIPGKYVGAVKKADDLSIILGRPISASEKNRLQSGGCLLLTGNLNGGSRKVSLGPPSGFPKTARPVEIECENISDSGFYYALPSVYVIADLPPESGLIVEPSLPALYLLRSTTGAAMTVGVIENSLPEVMRASASVTVEEGPLWVRSIQILSWIASLSGVIICLLIVLLFTIFRRIERHQSIKGLHKLGVSEWRLRKQHCAEIVMLFSASALSSFVCAFGLAYAFERAAGGSTSITPGVWILPIVGMFITLFTVPLIIPSRPEGGDAY